MVDSPNDGLTVPEDPSSDVEAALHCLVSNLETLARRRGLYGADTVHHDGVLLDVEVGDVRLLALRRGRPSPMSLLSPREQEIARMVAQGYANKTIASVLEISSWTVASHLRRIFVKLHVSSRAAMATSLLDIGFNELPAPRVNIISESGTDDSRAFGIETALHPAPSDQVHAPSRL